MSGQVRIESLQDQVDEDAQKALNVYMSAAITPLSAAMMGTKVTEAHGIVRPDGKVPRFAFVDLYCLSPEYGFTVGQKVRAPASQATTGGTITGTLINLLTLNLINKSYGAQPDVDLTNVTTVFGKDGIQLLRKDAGNIGVAVVITPAKWGYAHSVIA